MKLNAYARDSLAIDYHNYTLPALPTQNGLVYSPFDVYEFDKPDYIKSTNISKNLEFELKYVQVATDRLALIGDLTRCFRNLVPLIKYVDSPVSISEPIFHIGFSFMNFYYSNVTRVYRQIIYYFLI